MSRRTADVLCTLCLLGVVSLAGCRGGERGGGEAGEAGDPGGEGAAAALAGDSGLRQLTVARLGDLDSMRVHHQIRMLVVPSRTQYFLDEGTPRGLSVDAAGLFEKSLNKKFRTGTQPIHVVLLPVRHDELLPALLAGRGDIVASGLTITPERQAVADFSAPTLSNVSEIVVTGPASPRLDSIEDLAGKEVFVRPSSAYYESLLTLNASFKRRGLSPVRLHPAPEELEDEDLLEMLNAGLVQVVVMDDVLANFWQQVLPDITPRPGLTVKVGADLAWMIRKDSPQLKAEIDRFLAEYPAGSATRNTILQRYLKSTKYVTNAAADSELQKFREVVALFRKYGQQYDLDFLLMMAQGYQESRLDQRAHSPVGAIGIMQVMPATGKSLDVGDVREVEPNIHAGVKYVRTLIDDHFSDDSLDAFNRMLFSFAAYNAGPARVAGLRRKAAAQGLDPNKWLGNVEQVAAREIGRETVTYVRNIYKYYVAYTLVMEQEAERKAALKAHR
ncbi:MAG TPA: transporter substrate-binding domain-containing protein [Gemmatimonadales bacterium]|nr:transporter substrate-binding domain-containing protein [Gemmatimonadales bacterium]